MIKLLKLLIIYIKIKNFYCNSFQMILILKKIQTKVYFFICFPNVILKY